MRYLLDLLFPPRPDERLVREDTPEDFLTHLSPVLVPETRPGTVALLPFSRPSVRGALHEAKYHGSEHAFSLLGAALAEYLADIHSDAPLDEGFTRSITIVPVPLGQVRERERGFNQVEEVARRALRGLDPNEFVLNIDLLERVKETQSQVSLERSRREANMRGAFACRQDADPTHLYIVLDDVVTTGATLQAALDASSRSRSRISLGEKWT